MITIQPLKHTHIVFSSVPFWLGIASICVSHCLCVGEFPKYLSSTLLFFWALRRWLRPMARSVARKMEAVGWISWVSRCEQKALVLFYQLMMMEVCYSVESCSRQGSCLQWADPPYHGGHSGFFLFLTSTIDQFPYTFDTFFKWSLEADALFTFQLPASQQALVAKYWCCVYSYIDQLYKKIPPIFPFTKLILQQFWSVDSPF